MLAKTNFDRFMGNTTKTESYGGDDVKMYFHGRRLIEAMFKELDRPNGTSFCTGGGLVIQTDPRKPPYCIGGELVPDLSAATQIIVAGNSGGAGGLIMNMEYIKDKLVNIAPNARIIFVVASRMIPFLEAEAHFSNPPFDLYSAHYSGTSTMQSNSGVPGPPRGPVDATLTYSNSAFQTNGSVRDLLSPWGDPASSSEPFLDGSCKATHGNYDWRCFDEGHVALYHTDEDVFFYQGLKDSTHTNSSPLQWVTDAVVDPANGAPGASFSTAPWGGWLFMNPNGDSYSMEKSERVVYMAEQMWANHPGSGRVAFYVPEANCHTAITRSAFWADTMTSVLAGTKSFGTYLKYWIDNYINIGNPYNIGAVDSNNTTEQFSGDAIVSSSMTCPP
ncbi:MAG: hypothetical protein ACREXK_06425 [Gammaproteobacteria bacterium]